MSRYELAYAVLYEGEVIGVTNKLTNIPEIIRDQLELPEARADLQLVPPLEELREPVKLLVREPGVTMTWEVEVQLTCVYVGG